MKWKHAKKKKTCEVASDISCIENLFAELEYLEKSIADQQNTTENKTFMAQVHNLVGTSKITSSLGVIDLVAVSNLLPNSRFEKQKFAAITIRLGEPTCTVLLFTSGKMVLTGCKSLLDCILASKIVTNLLCDGFPGNQFKLDGIKIQNIVGNALVPLRENEMIDLPRFYIDFNIFCTYQPNMFPGLIYRPTDLPLVLLIFFSGKVVITGAKNMRDVYTGWEIMQKLLISYKTIKIVDILSKKNK